MDKDFDSEEEYGREDDSESSDGEMDDGKMSSSDEKSSGSDGNHSSKNSASEQDDFANIKPVPDNYWMDPFLVRREATLLQVVNRGFNKRVIVFFNEKR